MALTRRSLIASAAGMLPAQVLRLPRRTRVAIIGLEGHPGEITGPLDRLPDVEVIAIATPDARQARDFSAGTKGAEKAVPYIDYRRMLDAAKPDLVAVCNTNGERASAVLECLSRGLPVIAEKPLATTRDDLESIKRAVRERHGKLGMLLPMRYEASYLALKRISDSGELGEVIQISSQKSYQLGDRPDWFKDRRTYGSTILWIGVHMIDLMLWSSGRKFTHAASFMGRSGFSGLGDMETTTSTSFRMDNGGTATLHMDYCLPATAAGHGDDRLRLAGTKGIAEYMAATGVTRVSTKSKPAQVVDLPPSGSVFVDFLDHVVNGRPATLPLDQIYAACDVTLAAHEAAATGKVVAV